jgi:hypothetical protein
VVEVFGDRSEFFQTYHFELPFWAICPLEFCCAYLFRLSPSAPGPKTRNIWQSACSTVSKLRALSRGPGNGSGLLLEPSILAESYAERAELPDDPELALDLTAPGYDTTRGKRFHGSIQLEHKEDLKARGEASPDDGEPLAMTFAVKVAAKARPKYENLVHSFPERSLSWMR